MIETIKDSLFTELRVVGTPCRALAQKNPKGEWVVYLLTADRRSDKVKRATALTCAKDRVQAEDYAGLIAVTAQEMALYK